MDSSEIFKEIMKSPKMKSLLNVPEAEEVNEDYNSSKPEVAVVRTIIEGQIRHTSDDGIFKTLTKMFDL